MGQRPFTPPKPLGGSLAKITSEAVLAARFFGAAATRRSQATLDSVVRPPELRNVPSPQMTHRLARRTRPSLGLAYLAATQHHAGQHPPPNPDRIRHG